MCAILLQCAIVFVEMTPVPVRGDTLFILPQNLASCRFVCALASKVVDTFVAVMRR